VVICVLIFALGYAWKGHLQSSYFCPLRAPDERFNFMSISTNSKEPQVVAPLRDELPLAQMEALLAESRAEGHNFVDRLVDDFMDGSNRFDQPGEALFGVYAGGQLVAVGGLNRDPYLPDENAGRVRHVYVLPAFRRQGAGRLLMHAIIAAARSSHFRLLTLRTLNPVADTFYRALGFRRDSDVEEATHHLVCQPLTQKQGQYLAFIHSYTAAHGRPPSEAEMQRAFRVTPPTVHSMILRLEENGWIARTPGQARSIRVLVSPDHFLPLNKDR